MAEPLSEALAQRLAAWREQGAPRFDPAGWARLEAVARRVAQHSGPARQALEQRLLQQLDDLAARFEAARSAMQAQAEAQAELIGQLPAAAAEELQRLQAEGDFKAWQRRLAAWQAAAVRSPLAGLLQHLAQQSAATDAEGPGHPAGVADGRALSAGSADSAASAAAAAASRSSAVPSAMPRFTSPGSAALAPPSELKTLRQFRSTWSRLSVDQQLSRSLAKVPDNSGPLNSHRLVLRALQQLREISPDYLHRFMAQLEGLIWLEQASAAQAAAALGAGRAGEAEKRRKPSR